MPEMKRPGSLNDDVSSRSHTTAAAGASPLSEMKRRPVLVDAQIVPVLLGARAMRDTNPPARVP